MASLAPFFAVLQLAPSIINLVDQAVVSVEQTLSGQPSTAKLAAALAKLDLWLKAAGQDVSAISSAQSVLTALVGASVAAFNAAAVFHKSTPAATA